LKRSNSPFLILTTVLILTGGGWSYPFRDALQKAFYYLSIDSTALSFEKKFGRQDSFRFEIINKFLDNPFTVYDFTHDFYTLLDTSLTLYPVLNFVGKYIYNLSCRQDLYQNRNLKQKINSLAEFYKESFVKIPPEEYDSLLRFSISFFVDEDDTQDVEYYKKVLNKYGFQVDSVGFDIENLLGLAAKVDKRKLECSLIQFLNLVEWMSKTTFSDTIIYTPFGKIYIGGEGDNEYYVNEYAVIIDRSGNDRYIFKRPDLHSNTISIIIDLKGNDRYDTEGGFFGPASGFFSLSAIIDSSGNDEYTGSYISLAAGIFGVGLIEDIRGDDRYEGKTCSEGAGFFGLGMLVDRGGNDIYLSTLEAQAFSSTMGVGILCDYEGDDIYYAGGRYIHHPLLPDQFRSFAQGFSIGIRDHASGGISILFDKNGNDVYYSEVYAQGTSYWYSFGALVDLEGNDAYHAAEYAQGAGIHLSTGILIDSTGNDMYYSRFGPSQGEGHDYSVGILIDMEGDDSYTVSGGQGIGLNNSCGIFVDFSGNDYYTSRETYGQSGANWARGSIGIGVFEDLGGEDIYRKGSLAENNFVWITNTGSVGIDTFWFPSPKPAYERKPMDIDFDTLDISELFKIASLWQVRENIKKVKIAREKLKERLDEAIDYVFKEKINTDKVLELRAIKAICSKNSEKVRPYILKTLGTKNDTVLRNLIWLTGEIRDTSLIDTFFRFKDHKNYRIRAQLAISIGKLKYKKGLPILYELMHDNNQAVKIRAIEAIGNIGSEESVDTLITLLTEDNHFVVQAALLRSLAKIKDGVSQKIIEKFKNYPDIRWLKALDLTEPAKDSLVVKQILVSIMDTIKSPVIRGYIFKILAKYKSRGIKTLFEIQREKEANPFVLKVIDDYLKKEE